MTQLINKEYNGNLVTFDLTSDLLISLTSMAKANGKLVGNWLQLQSTKEYLEEYSSSIGIPIDEIIVVKQGGNGGGTWACQDVALYFAQWLSPKFHIWCNKQIRELLTNGIVSLTLPKTLPEALRAYADEVEAHERTKIELDHKQGVIIGLVDTIDLSQKRQILNKVVRKGGSYKDRWNALYSHFENLYHCNISLMAERRGCSKLDYVDNHLGKLDKLYEIAAKLYETDVKQVRQELFGDA